MNVMNVIKNYMTQGMTPENILNKMAGNNPMFSNLINLQKQGKTAEVEKFARNFCKERNINFDEEMNKFKNMVR